MRRLQHIAAHVHGADAGSPLWVRLMDETQRPQPRGGGCRCTAEKWRFVCRCYHCLEHAGREGDFEWTPELVPSTLPPKKQLVACSTSSGNEDGKDGRGSGELGTLTVNGVTRLTSPDGQVVGPVSPAVHPRFSGISTFARLMTLSEAQAHSATQVSGSMLHVRLLAAHNLQNQDTGVLGDVSDPYVVIRIGQTEERTNIIRNNLNPVWEHTNSFALPITQKDGQVELVVMNANLTKDTPLGRVCLGLWTLSSGGWCHRRDQLEGGYGGELEYEVRLDHGQGQAADIGVLGVPFDSGCSFRPGARFGPESIRANSRLIRPYLIAMQQRPLLERQVVDAGDVAASPFGIHRAMEQILEDCRDKLKVVKRLVLMGGDHTLSYPAIKAVAEKFGPVALIHFDSHLDTFPPMYNQDVWHGSPFRKCWEEGLFTKDGSTHVGIRATTYSYQDFVDSDSMGIATLTAEDVHNRGVLDCLNYVRQRYEEKAQGAPIYLSIDIDVLDPSVAPGTGTPEFGGLLAHQLLQFVRGFKGLPIVGADVVEIAPAYDHAGITAMAAANLVLEELALINVCMDKDGF